MTLKSSKTYVSNEIASSKSSCFRFDNSSEVTSCMPQMTFTSQGTPSVEGVICVSMESSLLHRVPDSYQVITSLFNQVYGIIES